MHRVSAVVSITRRPRSIASMWLIRGISFASGHDAGVGVEHALHPVLGHQDALRADLERAQRRRRVGREERVAGAAREDHDAPLLEVADGAAPDVRLGHLLHRDGRLHPGRQAELLERVLDRQGVQHRRDHAHVVGRRAVHADGHPLEAAEDVARAHHDGDIDAALVRLVDLARDGRDAHRVDAVGLVAHERLARELQDDALEGRAVRPVVGPDGVAGVAATGQARTG